ncbi:hypothetical protein IWX64_003393 [Arthrobacter sp. CAN_A212]|uniref:YunG family protein n=1 Tax=Arthrobacter sp. CAN_A212 TaxID=2787719 RepID=UPI0018CBB082
MAVTLRTLEAAFRQAWGADTTCLQPSSLTRWHHNTPEYGQCGPTALVLQDLLGGDLLIADVVGRDEADQVHYWNRLSSGLEIDLTGEQFTADHMVGPPRVVVRPADGPRAYRQEYELLRARVLSALQLSD